MPLAGLTAVGGVAGLAGGMLGLGGGLLMVPLMVSGLSVPIRQAIRLSTLAVACSATAASLVLQEGRGQWMLGVLLGAVAAVAAQWTASRLDSVRAGTLAWLLRGLAALWAQTVVGGPWSWPCSRHDRSNAGTQPLLQAISGWSPRANNTLTRTPTDALPMSLPMI